MTRTAPSTPHPRGPSSARITTRWLLRGGIAELGLTLAQSVVLMYLVDRGDKDGKSFPSQVRMAAELGLSRKGVQLCLEHLTSIGVVTVTAKIKGRSNGYRVNEPANSVRTPPAYSTGQVVDNEPANSVRTKYLTVTEPGLPDLARSGPARASAHKALRAADDEEEVKGEENAPSPSGEGSPRRGAEGGDPATTPTHRASVPTQPQYAREPVADWPTVKPGEGKRTAA